MHRSHFADADADFIPLEPGTLVPRYGLSETSMYVGKSKFPLVQRLALKISVGISEIPGGKVT